MNKHQKALNYLDWHCNVVHKKQQDLLQELVDKETPMKPLDNGMSMSSNKKFNCRICKEHIYHNYKKHTRCHECGQKIDWSDEE